MAMGAGSEGFMGLGCGFKFFRFFSDYYGFSSGFFLVFFWFFPVFFRFSSGFFPVNFGASNLSFCLLSMK